jgi:hypothetical protein
MYRRTGQPERTKSRKQNDAHDHDAGKSTLLPSFCIHPDRLRRNAGLLRWYSSMSTYYEDLSQLALAKP